MEAEETSENNVENNELPSKESQVRQQQTTQTQGVYLKKHKRAQKSKLTKLKHHVEKLCNKRDQNWPEVK